MGQMRIPINANKKEATTMKMEVTAAKPAPGPIYPQAVAGNKTNKNPRNLKNHLVLIDMFTILIG